MKLVTLPLDIERPAVIIDEGRVYRYYQHTTMVGAVEHDHPYRRTSEKPPIAGAWQTPTTVLKESADR